MINHTRTLLFNRARYDKQDHSAVGEVFIDPTYAPVALPRQLRHIHELLLPVGASRYQRNYLMLCYQSLLHIPDLEPYTLKFDPRVTYDVDDRMYKEVFQPVPRLAISTTDQSFVVGTRTYNLDKFSGHGESYRWDVGRMSASSVSVRPSDKVERKVQFVSEANISNDVVLLPGALSIYFQSPTRSLPLTMNIVATLGVVKPFQLDGLVESVSRLALEPVAFTDQLFFPVPGYEDDITVFRTLWNSHPDTMYRIGGVLLALAYQIGRIRNARR